MGHLKNLWSPEEASRFAAEHSSAWGEDLALRIYSARLLGRERSLVLAGGGNASMKSLHPDLFGEAVPALYVKASGFDLAGIDVSGFPALELARLIGLYRLPDLDDVALTNALRLALFDHRSPTPSLETLVHAFLPPRHIDHTHADAVLALTNLAEGEKVVRKVLGDRVAVLPYTVPGLSLARASVDAFHDHPGAEAMVWMRHGILTWGETAEESYSSMIRLVSRAEEHLAEKASRRPRPSPSVSPEEADRRLAFAAPLLRGLLAGRDTGLPRRAIVLPLADREILSFLEAPGARALALAPALTADHLIRTRAFPLWVDRPDFADASALRSSLAEGLASWAESYRAYVARHDPELASSALDLNPRAVFLPAAGVLCAGPDAAAASAVRDITRGTLAAKTAASALGSYQGLPEEDLFHMEFRSFQRAKLEARGGALLTGSVALVTGAAGAIGSAICEQLLAAGCCVAATDLPGESLSSLAEELTSRFPGRVLGVPLDVTDEDSVGRALDLVIRFWGGVDLGVLNAGVAHVSLLAEMDLARFRTLEQVNVEGTLLLLRELARRFALQGAGGDVVLVSTKNVFAPGAGFGAYSATKAAAHQLARIASLELASLGVRVNMVAPDAVFSHGGRRSGLWQEVGPGRMRARGLDEKGLEEYYRDRNLLKTRVTAEDVARAVLFFATRQTPTTGATLPVDGGLPDATPR